MTLSEENYLKAIYHLEQLSGSGVSTNALAEEMQTKASSATDMVKKLADKQMLIHVPYQGATLSDAGRSHAVKVIRKHRLWETFLVEKLNFKWDEVHDVAEQLEHIKSEKLIDELDRFLEFPKYDPHGDPIPDKNGKFNTIEKITLTQALENKSYRCIGVKDDSSQFLKYLDSNQIGLGTSFEVVHKEPFDQSVKIKLKDKELVVSQSVAKNLFLETL
ncbi:metal-dependent transcriptional regulator [Subsaximicrobium wynnwilliamsii]|uniref:Transcriptional regulator MntR n=1 Tax=Subsaximicrobium wynnwilliamsii TaxID=291179 RepID=A0A5C6ZIE3_9FLAO|nr:metal-dependent transcriptional regulator [Subsaximicrobium wynnwilliamsii]TXD83852.1 metal-dependent transcriptional regulator [Subsaximicrobium wynnwilliamsii]TXD89593.1 metal-dependent transcriptional regulator [Subsaximicrobium wynnwilliamsii]TXE02616.1 metal-dependent transcriptional regulator [Subsaximicrobium wynnwilliamsii]